MKKIPIYFLFTLLVQAACAQSGSAKQVQWTFAAKKTGDKTYAVHMTATILGNYHLYAQDAGGEGPVPTQFTFVKSPLLILDGKVKEEGKLVSQFDAAFNHNLRYYETRVDFIQQVKVKGSARTSLTGKVEFMVCNDRQCLPPSEVDIKVSLGG